jgi:hypothetical protein
MSDREYHPADGTILLGPANDESDIWELLFTDAESGRERAETTSLKGGGRGARPALNRARDSGVVTFVDGAKEWRWTAEDADTDPLDDGGVYDPTEEF